MTQEKYELGGDDKNRVPKAIVTQLNKITRVQLPYAIFNHCNTEAGGRTRNFFTESGQVHEGQRVMITAYGDHTESVQWGTIERASGSIANKWFVQTPVQPA